MSSLATPLFDKFVLLFSNPIALDLLPPNNPIELVRLGAPNDPGKVVLLLLLPYFYNCLRNQQLHL